MDFKLVPSGAQSWHNGTIATSGKKFLYSSTMGLYVYSTAAHQLELVLTGHTQCISSVTWSPHKSSVDQFASSALDKTVCLWDAATGKQIKSISLENTPIVVEWNPFHSSEIAIAECDKTADKPKNTIWLWNVDTDALVRVHRTSGSRVSSMKWNNHQRGLLTYGLEDGSLVICDVQRDKSFTMTNDHKSAVLSVQWDPKSPLYLLAAFANGLVTLFDVESRAELHSFDKHTGGLSGLAWMPLAPGQFVTFSQRSGVVRVWNVSQKYALDMVRVGQSGFVDCVFFPNSHDALCSFHDGSVIIYDFKARITKFSLPGSHTETIFDVRYKPSNPAILATASYDSTVKIWNTDMMTCLTTLEHQEGLIYSVSWSPGDAHDIACATSKGSVVIWDTVSGRRLSTLRHHNGGAVYRVAWHPVDRERLLTSGHDGNVFLVTPTGTVCSRYHHGTTVYGLSWSPFNPNVFATACQDGGVRVFTVGTETPARQFKANSKRAFNVAWSPLVPNLLASCGDDLAVSVWNTTTGEPRSLTGHTQNVRALIWHPELPHLLLTGSWDATVRVWNVASGTCEMVSKDHFGDVYGLDCHRDRPFVFASSSRDTTLRFSVLTPHNTAYWVKCMLRRPVEDIIADAPTMSSAHPRLCGIGSKNMLDRWTTGRSEVERMKCLAMFFHDGDGMAELWNAVEVSAGFADTALPGSELIHASLLTTEAQEAARQLAIPRPVSIGQTMRREDALQEAAQLYLLSGALEQYCEVQIVLGNWTQALAVAPAVSLQYWRQLCSRRGSELLAADDAKALPWLLVSGEPEKAVDYLKSSSRLKEACMVAQASRASCFSGRGSASLERSGSNLSSADVRDRTAEAAPAVCQIVDEKARGLFARGQPIKAAAAFLTVDLVDNAVAMLIRGGEVELAYALAVCAAAENVDVAAAALARKCETLGLEDEALQLLDTLKDSLTQKSMFAARQTVVEPVALEALYAKAGIRSRKAFAEDAAQAMKDSKRDVVPAVKCYAFAGQHTEAARLAVSELEVLFSAPTWNLPRAYEIQQYLGCIRANTLDIGLKFAVLAYSAFVAAQKAMERHYCDIAAALLRTTRTLVKEYGLSFSVPTPLMVLQEATLLKRLRRFKDARALLERAGMWVDAALPPRPTSVELRIQALAASLVDAECEADSLSADHPSAIASADEIVLAGSYLPSAVRQSTYCISVISGKSVKLPTIPIVSGLSLPMNVSRNEAAMWCAVNPFSPLSDGTLWNPVL